MSTQDNIGKLLDDEFENHAFLPQKLELEDMDKGVFNYIKDLNISVTDETGNSRLIPIVYNTQELWAERRMNWKSMRSEYGEELTRPFLVLTRIAVKKGVSPLRRTIPVKKKFTFLKVPTFDGTLKGYTIYKIPQPTWVDTVYELVLVTTYVMDTNEFYHSLLSDIYADGQAYININGYWISTIIEDPSETRQEDLASERVYEVTFQITVRGKIVDPTQFEKVNTINKIQIKISEKKSK